jgi:hypothetical protein
MGNSIFFIFEPNEPLSEILTHKILLTSVSNGGVDLSIEASAKMDGIGFAAPRFVKLVVELRSNPKLNNFSII